jgi:predicted esterase
VGLPTVAHADDARAKGDTKPAGWCAPELEELPSRICYAPGTPSKNGRRTLVIFLHGILEENARLSSGTPAQYAQQRVMGMYSKRFGFTLLAPRRRNGVGPSGADKEIAWPAHEDSRAKVEKEIWDSIASARKTIETRDKAPFDDVFVVGFSNGAYYASSLALRGRLDVDGYGVLTGGAAPPDSIEAADKTKNRKPIFIGLATKDETAKKAGELMALLKKVNWPHEMLPRAVGHEFTDSQLEAALKYLAEQKAKGEVSTKTAAGKQPDGKGGGKPR